MVEPVHQNRCLDLTDILSMNAAKANTNPNVKLEIYELIMKMDKNNLREFE